MRRTPLSQPHRHARRCLDHRYLVIEGADKRVIVRLRRLLVDKSGEGCVMCSAIQRLEVHHRDGNPSHNELSNLGDFSFHERLSPKGRAGEPGGLLVVVPLVAGASSGAV
jgi:hypothetical protein